MNENNPPSTDPFEPTSLVTGMSSSEVARTVIFLGIQVGFLIASPFAGGFHNKVWSMLDSAILISSIGITGLLFVLDSKQARRFVFKVVVILYVCAVVDMSINVALTGWFGWQEMGLGR